MLNQQLIKYSLIAILMLLTSFCHAEQIRIYSNSFGGENYYINGRLVLQTTPNSFGGKNYNNNGKRIAQTYKFQGQEQFSRTPYFLRNAKFNSTNTRQGK